MPTRQNLELGRIQPLRLLMLVLAYLLPVSGTKLADALVDACLFTGGLSPLLWYLIVKPRYAATRQQLLAFALSAQEAVQLQSRELRRIGKARELTPDVLTLDLTMPGGTATKVIELLSRECPGAFGYVVKQSADTELLDAIRCVACGKIYTEVQLATASDRPAVIPRPWKGPTNVLSSLSECEREVLTMVAQGLTNQAVADRLDLSGKSVESYRARLMTKLGLHNRAELTQLAMEAGCSPAVAVKDEPALPRLLIQQVLDQNVCVRWLFAKLPS